MARPVPSMFPTSSMSSTMPYMSKTALLFVPADEVSSRALKTCAGQFPDFGDCTRL